MNINLKLSRRFASGLLAATLCLAPAIGDGQVNREPPETPIRRTQDENDDKALIGDINKTDLELNIAELGEIPLFDGESLDGWRGEEGRWTVEDGAITGQTTEDNPLKANTFLISEFDLPEDFELRLQFRIEGGNSGIQFRSDEFEPNRLKGYQADIDSQMRFMGILYEERERGILCERGQQVSINEEGKKVPGEKLELDEKEFAEKVGTADWHDYLIRARGTHIEFQIDGMTTAIIDDFQSEKAATDGLLGLQLHQGPPMKIQFRNINLKPLTEKPEADQSIDKNPESATPVAPQKNRVTDSPTKNTNEPSVRRP